VSIRFHRDEHISASIAAGPRRRDIDVTTAVDTGLTSATDAEQLAFCFSSGRVLVTQDDDFLRLHAQGHGHAGIAYCRQQSIVFREMLRRLVLIHDLLTPEEMAGRVEFP
jgi:predicted nuclease of predicted toxin-antitoxin system